MCPFGPCVARSETPAEVSDSEGRPSPACTLDASIAHSVYEASGMRSSGIGAHLGDTARPGLGANGQGQGRDGLHPTLQVEPADGKRCRAGHWGQAHVGRYIQLPPPDGLEGLAGIARDLGFDMQKLGLEEPRVLGLRVHRHRQTTRVPYCAKPLSHVVERGGILSLATFSQHQLDGKKSALVSSRCTFPLLQRKQKSKLLTLSCRTPGGTLCRASKRHSTA